MLPVVSKRTDLACIASGRSAGPTHPMSVTLPLHVAVVVQNGGTHALEVPADLGELRCTRMKHDSPSQTYPFPPLPRSPCPLPSCSVLTDHKAGHGRDKPQINPSSTETRLSYKRLLSRGSELSLEAFCLYSERKGTAILLYTVRIRMDIPLLGLRLWAF